MRDKVGEAAAEFRAGHSAVPTEQREAAEAFLAWLADDHFTLLGYSAYALEHTSDGVQLRRVKGAASASCASRTMAACRRASRHCRRRSRARARQPLPALTITKANTRSTVHRATYLDFIGVKRFARRRAR